MPETTVLERCAVTWDIPAVDGAPPTSRCIMFENHIDQNLPHVGDNQGGILPLLVRAEEEERMKKAKEDLKSKEIS